MQKITSQETQKTHINENLSLSDRNKLKLDGIIEIISSSDTNISLKLKDTPLIIMGNNINITRLDIEQGILEANGNFESIKYGKQTSLFKRIFK